MKLKDFDFRIVLGKDVLDNFVCGKDNCPCSTPLLYGMEARYYFNELYDKDCEIELWTGYKDSKGTRIYENDIIRTDKGEIFSVSGYDREITAWILLENGTPCCSMAEVMFESEIVEVIGNTHENKNLINYQKEQRDEKGSGSYGI